MPGELNGVLVGKEGTAQGASSHGLRIRWVVWEGMVPLLRMRLVEAVQALCGQKTLWVPLSCPLHQQGTRCQLRSVNPGASCLLRFTINPKRLHRGGTIFWDNPTLVTVQ